VGEGQGAVLKRKLIEVALPLEAINQASEQDGPKRKDHPWRLHYWWARRKLATARAVLFAQLVDDPSSHPDEFPTEEAQQAERKRLHELIERLVLWENVHDERLLGEAREEILRSTNGGPPPILDPFAGGGTIPVEAQRLGLVARASDLNPVAVLINKALIEIPPKFADRPPVFPGLADSKMRWNGAAGLAADVRAYGEWMRGEAEKRIGRHYPKATLPDGSEATVIAWIWARTVTCPNPACGIEMPLVRSWWLGKKKGKEAYVIPRVVDDAEHPSGKRVEFEIGHDPLQGPDTNDDGTVGRRGAVCIACGSAVPLNYVRSEGRERSLGQRQMAMVVEGARQRLYLSPNRDHVDASKVPRPEDVPGGELPTNPRDFKTPNYGLTRFADLFTNRQLLALTTFSNLVAEARECVLKDAVSFGMVRGERLESGGSGASSYADAVASYLGMSVSRGSDYMSNITTWHSKNEQIRNVFARQAIPMAWDFLETNFLSTGSGTWASQVRLAAQALEGLQIDVPGVAVQEPAQRAESSGALISTDPPYYDNVGYSDLSDFYYVWLRRSLRSIHRDLLGTMLVPKADELVANPYRHHGEEGAKKFFEEGFREVFAGARENALPDFPITIYYAFKQSDSGDDGEASTGWETLLDGMVRSGWAITATWPFRTETASRMLAQGTNALASSIVLALRPRPDDAPTTDRRGFIAALQGELPSALRELQQGRIAPVDLPQAAIGPGMAVFSRYASIIEADGSPMSVRSALARINEILDQVLNEQEGDFDPPTRFAIAWYRQHGYGTGSFGDANNIANARNTNVETMARSGILKSAAGKVTLLSPAKLPPEYDPALDEEISAWEVLHHMIAALEQGGIDAAAALLATAGSRAETPVDADLVKELAFLLFSLAEKNRWTKDALALNALATSWPEVIDAARDGVGNQIEEQSSFNFETGDD
jgi:putative DNA methylase